MNTFNPINTLKTGITALSVLLSVSAISCPDTLLVKKVGSKTSYSLDLSKKFNEKELKKFQCSPKFVLMSKSQKVILIDKEAQDKKARL